MAKHEINFWDLELDYHHFSADNQPNFMSYLELDWEKKLKANDTRVMFEFLWSMRLMLWQSLIERNLLEVRFIHDGQSGSGSGPYLFFGNTINLKELSTEELLRKPIGTLLECEYFSDSDRFLADYSDETGFLGLSTLQLEFLKYEEIEFDEDDVEVFFEFTFSADYRITSQNLPRKPWYQVSEEIQLKAVNSLIDLADAQLSEYSEFVQDVSDIFICMSLDLSSSNKVRQSALDYLAKLRITM